MKTSHVCVVDADECKVGTQCVHGAPEAIAAVLHHHRPVERVAIEKAPDDAADRARLARAGHFRRLHRWSSGAPELEGNECQQDRSARCRRACPGFYKEVHVKLPATHGVRSVITPADILSRHASGATTRSAVFAAPLGSGSASAKASGSSRACDGLHPFPALARC